MLYICAVKKLCHAIIRGLSKMARQGKYVGEHPQQENINDQFALDEIKAGGF